MGAPRCAFKDPATGKHCHIWARAGSKYCVHHTEGKVSVMTEDEKMALLEYEMRAIRHRNPRGVEKAKLLLALMAAHDRITKGPDQPAVLDRYGVEDDPGVKARREIDRKIAASKKR
jgi:hypothetical protein